MHADLISSTKRALGRARGLLLAVAATADLSAGIVERQAFRHGAAGEGAPPRLVEIEPERSGLGQLNLYQDPRSWRERFWAASAGAVGTGIAVGDFDGDQLPDVFLVFRESQNRLYRNLGDLRFADVTDQAGIYSSEDWGTGATAVDIEGDGDLDLYVCFYHAPNRLYVNDGAGHFSEQAYEWGLDVLDASNAAYFSDYDQDGDLDLYLQTNQFEANNDGDGQEDYLFRNEGDRFVEVSRTAGTRFGRRGLTLGHSALWFDADGNGLDDLYVANDFEQPDFFYLNRGNGQFEDAPLQLPLAPYSSMGSDVGDVDGDGRLDLLVADMAARSYLKHAESMMSSGMKTHDLSAENGPPQVMKNALLLNRGAGSFVDATYRFNLAATDWTWAARFADIDNDGWQDALFTTGMARQFHNMDITARMNLQRTEAARRQLVRRSPPLNEENLFLRNEAGAGFRLANDAWSYSHVGISYALTASDFDRDGDLDLLYSNRNGSPSLWRNDLGSGNAVQVSLQAKGGNPYAVGARLVADYGAHRQAFKVLSNRGYQTTDELVAHFGLGAAERLDSLEIFWPDGTRQSVGALEGGYRYTIEQTAGPASRPSEDIPVRFELVERETVADPETQPVPDGLELLTPIKPLPPKLVRSELAADFDGDGQGDRFALGQWSASRLELGDGAAPWDLGSASRAGLWQTGLVFDANGDGFPEVVCGGLGLNHDLAYRSDSEPFLTRQLGRFLGRGERVYLYALRWGDTLRISASLMDLVDLYVYAMWEDGKTGVSSSLLELLDFKDGNSRNALAFRKSGLMTRDQFVEKASFQVQEEARVEETRSLLLLNQAGKGFKEVAMPPEFQYGRIWDLEVLDVNHDSHPDLVALMGHLTIHPRSPQGESTFLYVFLGDGQGGFSTDPLPPFRSPVQYNLQRLDLSPGEHPSLIVETFDGERITYQPASNN